MDRDHLDWLARVAEAARRAAEALRGLDDPQQRELLADLDDLHERLTAELRSARLADP